MAVKTLIDVEKLLVWTYQRQRADDVVSAVGGSSLAAHAKAQSWGMGGGGGGATTDIHPDALLVHGVVRQLSKLHCGLVIMHARTGGRPDWLPGATFKLVAALNGKGKPMMDRDPVTHRFNLCYLKYHFDREARIFDPANIAVARLTYLHWAEGVTIVAGRLAEMEMRDFIVAEAAFPLKPWEADGNKPVDTARKT